MTDGSFSVASSRAAPLHPPQPAGGTAGRGRALRSPRRMRVAGRRRTTSAGTPASSRRRGGAVTRSLRRDDGAVKLAAYRGEQRSMPCEVMQDVRTDDGGARRVRGARVPGGDRWPGRPRSRLDGGDGDGDGPGRSDAGAHGRQGQDAVLPQHRYAGAQHLHRRVRPGLAAAPERLRADVRGPAPRQAGARPDGERTAGELQQGTCSTPTPATPRPTRRTARGSPARGGWRPWT